MIKCVRPNFQPSYTKCLLRLNEPRLALSGIADLLKRPESVEFQESTHFIHFSEG